MIAFLTIVTIISIVTTWQRFLFVQADSFSIMLTVSAPSSLLFAGGSEHDSAHQVCAKAAFPNDFSKEVTKRGSYCSVIEELGQDGDPTRTDQPNQIPLLSSAAFFTQKPLMSDETYECEAPGGSVPLDLYLHERFPKRCLFEKPLQPNPNLQAHSEHQSSAAQQPNGIVDTCQFFTRSPSNAVSAAPNREKKRFSALSNHLGSMKFLLGTSQLNIPNVGRASLVGLLCACSK